MHIGPPPPLKIGEQEHSICIYVLLILSVICTVTFIQVVMYNNYVYKNNIIIIVVISLHSITNTAMLNIALLTV